MKKIILGAWLMILLIIIGMLFWISEWRYGLPTAVPSNYHAVKQGEHISLPIRVDDTLKPVFLHFFNPACPCSRFNIPAFRKLAVKYSGQVNFAIIVLSSEHYTVKEIQQKFDLKIPVFFDAPTAVACGVYATPQVALLDSRRRLFYRGNYNSSRYCTNESTNYAAIALYSLVRNEHHTAFGALALRAYGCSLPDCQK